MPGGNFCKMKMDFCDIDEVWVFEEAIFNRLMTKIDTQLPLRRITKPLDSLSTQIYCREILDSSLTAKLDSGQAVVLLGIFNLHKSLKLSS
jgi:hypothetical protein